MSDRRANMLRLNFFLVSSTHAKSFSGAFNDMGLPRHSHERKTWNNKKTTIICVNLIQSARFRLHPRLAKLRLRRLHSTMETLKASLESLLDYSPCDDAQVDDKEHFACSRRAASVISLSFAPHFLRNVADYKLIFDCEPRTNAKPFGLALIRREKKLDSASSQCQVIH